MDPPAAATRHRFDTLDEWLAWLETLHPKKIDFSLDRVRAVLSALSLDTPSYRIVTVAGTNGKGSCVAMLESIYLAAGYRVGAFTSPHLWRFNERIRFNGSDASDRTLIELFEIIDSALGAVTLSYFEASAVAAMLHFARESADVAILEVGMGGRLDAVNALDADAALIVSIDVDHVDWLGPDRETIAREKAGIVRPGCPVVVADGDPPASLIDEIATRGGVLHLIGRDFSVERRQDSLVLTSGENEPREFPRPRFGDSHQVVNAAAVIATIETISTKNLPVDSESIARGLIDADVRGRIDRFKIDGVEWIFDVAHNVAATRHLHQAVARLTPVPRTLAVFGAMRDKQLDGVVAPFVGDIDAWFVAPIDSDRGASADDLSRILGAAGARSVTRHADVAVATLEAAAAGADRVVVFGSFYTVGPAMAALGIYCPT